MFLTFSTANSEGSLGARDILNAAAQKDLPVTVAGLNALCSEFHFYSRVSMPDYSVIFLVRDINQIAVGVSEGEGDFGKDLGKRKTTSIDSAYYTACEFLRKHLSGH